MSTHSTNTGALDANNQELVAEAHSLLDRLSHSKLGEEAKILAAKLRDGVETLKTKSAEAVDVIKAKSIEAQKQVKVGVEKTEEAIKDHPWTAVGVAVGVGVVIGLLIRRD